VSAPNLLLRAVEGFLPAPLPSLDDDLAVPGKQTAITETSQAAASDSARSRVKAYADETLAEGGFAYAVTADGDFVVTGVPAAPESVKRALGRQITPDGTYAAAWTKLAQRLFARPPKRAQTAEPAAPDEAPAGTKIDDNLACASDLAAHFNVPHTYKVAAQPGDAQTQARVDALKAGNTKALKTIICSEFTTLSLARAGIDLSQRYLHPTPAGKLPVAYRDPDKGRLRFVDLYMVVGNWPEVGLTLHALREGKLETVEAGSDRAKKLGAATEPTAFLYNPSAAGTSEITADDQFGAGAAAVGLGGERVDQVDRKPGDIQQRADTVKGKTNFYGHSSQVWKVQGGGVAYLGAAGSPIVVPTPAEELAPGWYQADGAKTFFELAPDTDPALVAKFSTSKVQLVEANYSTADATDYSRMVPVDEPYDPKAARSSVTSTGRLPKSKWFGWKEREPEEVTPLPEPAAPDPKAAKPSAAK
jgi:hypothetical protein